MKKLLIIDGNSLINRAYFGIPALNAPDGTPTNAVYGFIRILNKLIADEAPDGMLVAFDRPEPTFRHEIADFYKATRHGMPDDLAAQMPLAKEALDYLGYSRYEKPGFEADDIIGTVAIAAEREGIDAVIVTGDRDALQLIGASGRVLLIKTAKGVTETIDYDDARFRSEYGFEPIKLIDLKALMGDGSDNIPGVRGIGEKTAMQLINTYGSLDGVYEHTDELKGAQKEKIVSGKDDAYLSYKLAAINTEAPLDVALSELDIHERNTEALLSLFGRLGFYKLIESMGLVSEASSPAAVNLPAGTDIAAEAAKIGTNTKDAIRRGEPAREFDLALAGYVVNPTGRDYSTKTLAQQYLGNIVSDDNTDEKSVALRFALDEKLRSQNAEKLFYDTEMLLCSVLADMETRGVLVDRGALREYGAMLGERLKEAEQTIYFVTGVEFNINSPKQLGEVLFDHMKLPAPKKTKTGYSTSVDVLDKLEPRYPIITRVKEYRELAKLKATYADGLDAVIADDGRIHTSYQMTATATGRLSSTEPNLQNIPIRKPLGEQLRHMFIAPDGCVLVGADYSQIELRILAHIAGDSAMIEAFASGEDFHAFTAARVFGVPLDEVTKLQRSRAKAVNFGIVYGISAFSLSQDIGTSVAEAKDYMETYFERFSGVRAYMHDIVARAKKDGYVETLFGRRRTIPEIVSSDHNTRAFGERVALNMPIQGTAADIMKIAMVSAHKALRENAPESGLILQIHDELIAEAPENSAETVQRILTEAMESAADLRVPLKTESGIGKSWADCK